MYYPVFWLMGMSGSGKTTLTNLMLKEFSDLFSIDNDKFRGNNKDFSKSTRIATVDALREKCIQESLYHPIIVNKITPYEIEMRLKNRNLIPNYYEIYCKCSIDTLIQRDVKGLYKKAINNELEHMIGVSKDIDDIYEEPINPDIVINTELPLQICSSKLYNFISKRINNHV